MDRPISGVYCSSSLWGGDGSRWEGPSRTLKWTEPKRGSLWLPDDDLLPKGKRKLGEIWSNDYGLTLRRVGEDPTGAKYYEELISLRRDEPSLSTFHPPNDTRL
jgi:hypothetical protein